MSRATTLFLIIGLWAALYLPFLGSLEIRGEEGKRVMPTVQMLETGNYLVPYLGAYPYLNKPPLLNWLVAAAFGFAFWSLRPANGNPLPLLILTAISGALSAVFFAWRFARDPRWLAERIEATFPELRTCLLAAVEQQRSTWTKTGAVVESMSDAAIVELVVAPLLYRR